MLFHLSGYEIFLERKACLLVRKSRNCINEMSIWNVASQIVSNKSYQGEQCVVEALYPFRSEIPL